MPVSGTGLLQLIPTPITALVIRCCCTLVSVSIPPSFRPFSTKSFGHFRETGIPLWRKAWAIPQALHIVSWTPCWTGRLGVSNKDKYNPPVGECHCLPHCPFPASCSKLMTTVPGGASSLTNSHNVWLVEGRVENRCSEKFQSSFVDWIWEFLIDSRAAVNFCRSNSTIQCFFLIVSETGFLQ